MDVLFDVVVLVILIALAAFFSCAELALVSTSHIKVKSFVDERRRGADALHRLKKNPWRMITIILIANTVVTIAAASFAAVIVTDIFGSSGLGIATGAMTLITLVFVEILPKTFATTHAGRISLAVAGSIEALGYALYPLVAVFERLSNFAMGMVKVKGMEPVTKSEIRAMIEFGGEKNVIEPEEKEIMERALRFSGTKVQDVMTQFDRILCLDGNSTIDHSFNQIAASGFSRIPVYTGRREKMMGVLFVKNVLKAMDEGRGDTRLKNIATKPIVVSKETGIDDLLKVFRDKKMHIALVRDGGRVVGLVTIEDILEELIGHMAW